MSRTHALADENFHRFIDPISLDLMKDPVIAADGHFYDRETITAWFETLRAQGRQIKSPVTNLPLKDEILTPNTAMKRDLDMFIASTSSIRPADIQFTLSSEIFKELDKISSMSEVRILDFEAPKIVVLGNESHGKSTVLERVIGLPLFPKEKGICTRCVVRVHLRRSVADQPSIAEIYAQKVTAGGGKAQNDPPQSLQIVALDNIREKIKEVMDDLVRNDPLQRMIVDDHEIIVKINLPYCLNIDILDLPGLVTTSPASTTQNLPQVTKEIAMRVIREQKESSFFLLVNDVRVPPNQSRGCEVVQEAKIEAQTLGIFTKVDTFVSEEGSEVAELQQLLDSTAGGFPLGYGWMAAASRSVDIAAPTNKLKIFQLMEQNESKFFQEKYTSLLPLNKLGIHQIRQRIQTLYESFIHNHWIPVILTKVKELITRFQQQLVVLGTPVPEDNDYKVYLEGLRVMLPTINEDWIDDIFKRILSALFTNCEKELIKIRDDDVFWDLMNRYHLFIGEEDEKSAYSKYTNGHSKSRSDRATSGGGTQPTPSASSHGIGPVPGQGNLSANIRSQPAPPRPVQNPQQIPVASNAFGSSAGSNPFASSAFGVTQEKTGPKTPPSTTATTFAQRSVKLRSTLSASSTTSFMSNTLGKQPDFSLGTPDRRPDLKSGRRRLHVNSFATTDKADTNRDVSAFEANKTLEALESTFKEYLDLLYKRLHDLVNPNTKFIREVIIKMAPQCDSFFKLERFDSLLSILIEIVEGQLKKIVQSFDDWFREFIRSIYEKPLLYSVYYREETVRCKLHWSNPYDLHKYPHKMLDKFYQCIQENFNTTLISSLQLSIDVTLLQENCKEDRLKAFKELKKLNEVKDAVELFDRQVRSEMEAMKQK